MGKKETWSQKLKRELAEAKAELQEFKDKAILDTEDNVFTKEELKTIVVYKYGFWILGALNIILLAVLFS